MAKKFTNTNDSKVTFSYKGMNKDLDPFLLDEGEYTHAINLQVNSHEGNAFLPQNEPSNFKCASLPSGYKHIGTIPLIKNRFVIFSTNNTGSEIGIFDENFCKYETLVNDDCLNFSTSHLIKGVSRENVNKSESIYWADGNNVNRYLNLNDIPRTFTFADDDCKSKIFGTDLDCEALKIDQVIDVPCSSIKKGTATGNLQNGSYQVAMAYSINSQKVTNYYAVSSPQQIFTHENLGNSIDVEFTNLDRDFDNYTVYLIATIAQQTSVYEIGSYETNQNRITITDFTSALNIPLSDLFLQKVIYNKSKDVIAINNQLIWVGADSTPELNYQSQAVKASAEWKAYAVDKEYYKNGGNLVGYMRDETYAFGIQWLYDTGEWSSVFPLVGRAATGDEKSVISGKDAYESKVSACAAKPKVEKWEAYNTASGVVSESLDPCREEEIGRGRMAYTESSEKYPDNKELWGDLACTPIRHFKFPDDCIVPRKKNESDDYIIILGIEFTNIEHPRDANGKLIENIKGYRIVRSDRTTNKSIISKGLLYNTGEYERPTSLSSTEKTLYPNYPFNDLRPDPFLNKKEVKGGSSKDRFSPLDTFNDDVFTYHSPSHSFAKPSFGTELRIYGEDYGTAETVFDGVYNHPKNKLLTNTAFLAAILLGIGEGFLATREKECITTMYGISDAIAGATTIPGSAAPFVAAIETYTKAVETANKSIEPAKSIALEAAKTVFIGAISAGNAATISTEQCPTLWTSIPKLLRVAQQIPLFSFYFQQGFDTALNVIESFARFQDYAQQVNSYGHYNKFFCSSQGNQRRYISDINYLNPVLQNFEGTRVNNFRRESAVIMRLNEGINRPINQDTSRQTIGTAGVCEKERKTTTSTISSHYAAIKNQLPNQYGQINSIQWLDTGLCYKISTPFNSYRTGIVFGGDTYLTRFTLKRKQHFFNQTAFNENDGFEFDYKKYYNVLYPSYWVDTFKYDSSKLVSFTPEIPKDQHSLDCKESIKSGLATPFIVNNRYFYLFNSGIVDFYVESEYNLDLRDYEEQDWLRHYDRDNFTDLSVLFRHDHIEFDNRYKYDKSLLKQLTENSLYTQNQLLGDELDFDCCSNNPNRVFWSLPYFNGQIKDSWGFYLPNNFYDFPHETGDLIAAKPLDRTNIVFLFSDSGPYLHQAIDQLQTDNGIKVTLGDGGLFSRQPQPIVTTDVKYGNAQSKHAVTNTQYGMLFPSPSQGRMFLLQGSKLNEINQEGMNWWLRKNMPFKITDCIENFDNLDNTIDGVGYLTVFDNIDEVFYITKIDYCCKEGAQVRYDKDTKKLYKTLKGREFETTFQDESVFDNASWTLSYNPRLKHFISFHDWHPYSVIQTEKRFLTTNRIGDTSLWKHNDTCSSYCKFYDTRFSFDYEYCLNNKINTNVLQSIEYYLEVYKYYNDCYDRHHVFEDNFTEAFLYNTEQLSGLLKFNKDVKKDLSQLLKYPQINSDSIDIKYNKEEQKYRFNQFWDIVKDRGEFTNNTFRLFDTECNGYRFNINKEAVDYDKTNFQRKKFRHNWHKVYLRKTVGDREEMNKIIIKSQINRQINSPR